MHLPVACKGHGAPLSPPAGADACWWATEQIGTMGELHPGVARKDLRYVSSAGRLTIWHAGRIWKPFCRSPDHYRYTSLPAYPPVLLSCWWSARHTGGSGQATHCGKAAARCCATWSLFDGNTSRQLPPGKKLA